MKELEANDNEVVEGDDKANNRNLSKKLKNAKSKIQTRIKAIEESTFPTPGTKETFN